MSRLRVLVVDDERLARQGLRDFLERESDVEIVGECATGVQALKFLDAHEVDVAFLDVQMPELDGLGVAAALEQPAALSIVFVTAFSEHAVRAFELNAVDYLLKPFDYERFRAALDRVRARRGTMSAAELAQRLTETLTALQRGRGYVDRVLVKDRGLIHLVAVDDIDWLEAADNYVRVHAGEDQHLLRETMARLEDRLDPARFARIHRSTIVNLSRVRLLEPTFNGEYTVLLRSGVKLTLSRTYRNAVRARLGGEW
jgi:two-component system LytT family response regulator